MAGARALGGRRPGLCAFLVCLGYGLTVETGNQRNLSRYSRYMDVDRNCLIII